MITAVRDYVEQLQDTHTVPDVMLERSLHRLTLDDYHWLIEHVFFQPEDRVELIEGYLVEMSPLHPPMPPLLMR